MRKISIQAAAAALLAAGPVYAGPYADDMAKCMVRSSTPADHAVFIRFIFTAMVQHPDVAAMAKVTPQQLDDTLKSTGELVQRLLLETCRSETQLAIRYEGLQTVYGAFQIFGQAMAAELFGNAAVTAKMNGINRYMDPERFKKFATEAAAAAAPPAPPPPPAPPAPHQ